MMINVDKDRFGREINEKAINFPMVGDVFILYGNEHEIIAMKGGYTILYKDNYRNGTDCYSNEIIIIPSYNFSNFARNSGAIFENGYSSCWYYRKHEIAEKERAFVFVDDKLCKNHFPSCYCKYKILVNIHQSKDSFYEFLKNSSIDVAWLNNYSFLAESDDVLTLMRLSNPDIKFSEIYFDFGFLKTILT